MAKGVVETGFMSCPALQKYMKEKKPIYGKGIGIGCTCLYNLGGASISASYVTHTFEREGVDVEYHPLEGIDICAVILCTNNPEKHQELVDIVKNSRKALVPQEELEKYLKAIE
jgi:hypothetical protein